MVIQTIMNPGFPFFLAYQSIVLLGGAVWAPFLKSIAPLWVLWKFVGAIGVQWQREVS
jgi:hypothetical protein